MNFSQKCSVQIVFWSLKKGGGMKLLYERDGGGGELFYEVLSLHQFIIMFFQYLLIVI